MAALDVSALESCLNTLKRAHGRLLQTDLEDDDHDLFRAACVKEFKLILEITAKLLRRALGEYMTSDRAALQLSFKDGFCSAARYGLFSVGEVDRWFQYRDDRNDTAHEYGKNFAQKIVVALPAFIADAKAAPTTLRKRL